MTFKEEVEEKLRNLAKPPGSLGLLEQQAKKIFLAWHNLSHLLYYYSAI